jgi:hypothetical protein
MNFVGNLTNLVGGGIFVGMETENQNNNTDASPQDEFLKEEREKYLANNSNTLDEKPPESSPTPTPVPVSSVSGGSFAAKKQETSSKIPIGLLLITIYYVLVLGSAIIGKSSIYSIALDAFIVLSLILLIISRKSMAMTCVIVPTLLAAVVTIIALVPSLGLIVRLFTLAPLQVLISLSMICVSIVTPFYLSRLRKKGFIVK